MNVSARSSREEVAWSEGLVLSLVHRAARNAPPALSERLAEEWLADLTARHGAFARLRFALGCAWATRVIAHEMGVPARATAPASADRAAALCVQPVPSFYSRRSMVLLLIVALHILVIYGLAAGMASAVLRRLPEVIHTTFIKPPRTQPLPPPPPNVTLARVDVTVPRTDLALDLTPAPGAISAVEVNSPPPTVPVEAVPPPHPVKRVLGGPGPDFPTTSDFYPDASRRLGEQGVATIQVCVDRRGQLTAPPVIAQSSGSARLDGGGLKLARAGSGHYRATTEDGRPVDGCYAFRVRFDFR